MIPGNEVGDKQRSLLCKQPGPQGRLLVSGP